MHWNGSVWTPFASGTDHDFPGLWVSGPTDAWAIGAGWRRRALERTAWTLVPTARRRSWWVFGPADRATHGRSGGGHDPPLGRNSVVDRARGGSMKSMARRQPGGRVHRDALTAGCCNSALDIHEARCCRRLPNDVHDRRHGGRQRRNLRLPEQLRRPARQLVHGQRRHEQRPRAGAGSPSSRRTIPGGRDGSRYAARMTGSGFTGWGALMGFNLNVQGLGNEPISATGAGGVRFWMKSNVPVASRSRCGRPSPAAAAERAWTARTHNCDNHFDFLISAPEPINGSNTTCRSPRWLKPCASTGKATRSSARSLESGLPDRHPVLRAAPADRDRSGVRRLGGRHHFL